MIASARLTDVKLVLSAPARFTTRRKAISDLQVGYGTAKQAFMWRATPATWAPLVTVAKQLHAAVKAERDRLEKAEPRRQIEGLGGKERGTGDL